MQQILKSICSLDCARRDKWKIMLCSWGTTKFKTMNSWPLNGLKETWSSILCLLEHLKTKILVNYIMVNMGKAIGSIQWKGLNNTWLSRKETFWQWPSTWMSSTWPGSSTKSVSNEHISKNQPRASIHSSSSARIPKLYYNEMIHHNPYIIYTSYI